MSMGTAHFSQNPSCGKPTLLIVQNEAENKNVGFARSSIRSVLLKMFLLSSLLIVLLAFKSGYLLHTSDEPSLLAPAQCSQAQNVDVNEIEKDAYYIGTLKNSHISHELPKKFQSLNVTLELKTTQNRGVIFYVGGSKKDFYSLYLQGNDLHFSYFCDGYMNSYVIKASVNDGKWHTLEVISNSSLTELVIDRNFYTGRASGCRKPDLESPCFFGAIDAGYHEMAKSHLANITEPIIGCMRRIEVDGSASSTFHRVAPCRTHAEPGTTFNGNGSFMIVDKEFDVNSISYIHMDIRPRTSDAVLLFLETKHNGSYLLLELVGSLVKLTVWNGDGSLSTKFNCSGTYNLCDGKWHTISIIRRKNIHLLTVNKRTAPPIMYFGTKYFEGNGPLYLGGVPRTETRADPPDYIGCIRDLSINDRYRDFLTFRRREVRFCDYEALRGFRYHRKSNPYASKERERQMQEHSKVTSEILRD